MPSSGKTFPDGAHCRIEIFGIESAEILEAVVNEAEKTGVPIHRVVATVAGSKFYSDEQLKKLAEAAAGNKIEVIICPGDFAMAVMGTPDKILTGLNWQSNEEATEYFKEIVRCARFGFSGFLVWQKGMLYTLSELSDRYCGELYGMPANVIFKLSVIDNNANIADFALSERLGAHSIDAANLTFKSLVNVRQKTAIPMSVRATFWQWLVFLKNNEKGLELKVNLCDRTEDTPEIVRVASPVYLSFGDGTPGISVYDELRPTWYLDGLAEHKREDVCKAAKAIEAIKAQKEYRHLKISAWGPKDLRVPKI